MRKRFTLVIAWLALALPMQPTALLAEEVRDSDRPGWSVGTGFGVAFNFFDNAISKETTGIIRISPSPTLNLRVGYRFLPWLGVEGMYEGAHSFGVTVFGREDGRLRTHSYVLNGKLVWPFTHFQPYGMLGVGTQSGDFTGERTLAGNDTYRWDSMLRLSLGMDAYVTNHWVVDVEIAPSLRFASFADIPSQLTDNVVMSMSAGVKYRY